MSEVLQTGAFSAWLSDLRDREARARIIARIRRIEQGNLGDVKSLGNGLGEVRIHHGPGYRLYFCRRGEAIVILLCGGDKSAQERDIQRAREFLKGMS
ncbi:type II toxin-antitoxin system RelE/ParE family toxin [Martelella soudanensis]|uniref:type II toxin-antitoxin system RelE/ParE family toxin n=1 Tax=unclassified Martelella TaxID=2629616 RepID=UPI0015DE01E3|nr:MULTISPECIES: type II toxin-antitoxin system RelE/ParE family toxin [unclassified Martelella]